MGRTHLVWRVCGRRRARDDLTDPSRLIAAIARYVIGATLTSAGAARYAKTLRQRDVVCGIKVEGLLSPALFRSGGAGERSIDRQVRVGQAPPLGGAAMCGRTAFHAV